MKKLLVVMILLSACSVSNLQAQYNPILNPLFDGMVFFNPGYFEDSVQWQAVHTTRIYSPKIERWAALRGVHTERYLDRNYVEQVLNLVDAAVGHSGFKTGASHSFTGSRIYNMSTFSVHGSKRFQLSKKWKLGLGTRVNVSREVLDLTRLTAIDPSDPLLTRSTATHLDADAGLWLSNGKAYFGYSLKNIFQSYQNHLFYQGVDYENLHELDLFQPESFLALGYIFTFRDWSLEASYQNQSYISQPRAYVPFMGSLNMELGYQNRFFIGLSNQYLGGTTVNNYQVRARVRKHCSVFGTLARSGDYVIRSTSSGYEGPNYVGFGVSFTMPAAAVLD